MCLPASLLRSQLCELGKVNDLATELATSRVVIVKDFGGESQVVLKPCLFRHDLDTGSNEKVAVCPRRANAEVDAVNLT